MKRAHVASPQATLIDSVEHGNGGTVVVAHIADPSLLLDGRFRRLHADVVEVLVDLTLALLDEEAPVEGSNH